MHFHSDSDGGVRPAQEHIMQLEPTAKVPTLVHADSKAQQEVIHDHVTTTSTVAATATLDAVSGTAEQPLTGEKLSKIKAATVITTLAGISFLNTMGSGILIAALPRIASDVGLSEGFLLWPASVYALAAGCLLLIFGAVADVIGAKLTWVTGSFFYAVFSMAVGLSKTGTQLILFRTLLGMSIAMCLPTAVSLITNTFPQGTYRNVAFATNGMGQPLGYALGLILGGIFTDTVGWRWAFFMSALINICLSVSAIFALPSVHHRTDKKWTTRLWQDIDWVGAIVMSAALGMLLYVLAVTTSSYENLTDARNIALLVLAVTLLGVFPAWMAFQTKRGKPALIPNRLWRNTAFTAVCVSVFFCWGALNAIQYFATLFFQEVQGLSALQSSIRFLPHVIMGVCVNVLTGWLISKVKVQTLTVVSSIITLAAAPLLATIPIHQSFWYAAFWAMLLSPVSADVLFTVSNIVISNAFPPEVQSLAGGVFNEVSQIGNSVGLAVTAAIAASVSKQSGLEPVESLMSGYRAAFWTIFAASCLVTVVLFYGLRKSGTVGKKDE